MRLRPLVYAAILLSALAMSASGQETRKAIVKITPRYPEVARRINLVGTVKVEVVISADGKIKNTTVVGGHPILISATLDALREWKYEPSKTETVATLIFEFRP
jgi:TonB family protein